MTSPKSSLSDSTLQDDDRMDHVEAQTPVHDVDTPLLATDLPPEVVPDKQFQQTVFFICCVFLGFVEVYMFLTSSPLQEIIEDFICHSQYPDHIMNKPTIQDSRCKATDVQKTLAMVRSWWQTTELWVPLLVQIPYGIIADKYGRRPVIFLSLLGVLIEGCLAIIVLRHPETFSVWAIVGTSLAYFIGGGPPMAVAMIWTILSDAIPTAQRTTAFYHVSALGIVLGAVLNPIAAWLMSMDPWLPMWMGFSCMVLGTFSALFVPETLRLRKQADAVHHQRRGSTASEPLLPGEEFASDDRPVAPKAYVKELLFGAKKNTEHIWHFVLGSKSVMLLVASLGFSYPIRMSFEIFVLQYSAKRFDWTWSTATYYFTINKVTGVVMLLVVLPLVSKLVTRSVGDHPLKRDLHLARYSIAFVIVSCVLASVAFAPPVLVVSLVSYGIGTGFISQMRALACGVVEPHTIATLNTVISSTEAIMGSIGVPAFGWLLSRGIELGGAWQGLPFLVSTAFALSVGLFLWLFRIPRDFL